MKVLSIAEVLNSATNGHTELFITTAEDGMSIEFQYTQTVVAEKQDRRGFPHRTSGTTCLHSHEHRLGELNEEKCRCYCNREGVLRRQMQRFGL